MELALCRSYIATQYPKVDHCRLRSQPQVILVSLILYNLLRSDLHRAPLLLHPRLFELRHALLGPHALERLHNLGLPPLAIVLLHHYNHLFELRHALLGLHVLKHHHVVGLPPVALDTRYPPARHLDMNIMYEVN